MKFLVIGSLASKEALGLDLQGFRAIEHIHRRSFASLMRDRPLRLTRSDFPAAPDETPAIRQAIEEDLTGAFALRLRSILRGCDVILVDLLEERFPLLLDQGLPLTLSRTLQGAEPPPGTRVIRCHTEDYLRFWDVGFTQFVRSVRPYGKTIILNTCLWAEDHDATEPGTLSNIRQVNGTLRRMHARAIELGVRPIDYGDHRFAADPDHRLGPAPFHLSRETGRRMVSQITRICGGF